MGELKLTSRGYLSEHAYNHLKREALWRPLTREERFMIRQYERFRPTSSWR